jgi:hypothetical protein
MPNVSLRSPSILSDLRREIGEFANKVPGELQAVDRDIRNTVEFLREREQFWQREVQRCLEAVAACEHALQRCQSSRRGDKEEHRSCTPEEQALARARTRLHEAEAHLQNVRRWLARVEQAVAQYRRQSERLKSLVSTVAPQARTRLGAHERAARSYLESLRRYQALDGFLTPSQAMANALATSGVGSLAVLASANGSENDYNDIDQADLSLQLLDNAGMVLSELDKHRLDLVLNALRQISGLNTEIWANSRLEEKVVTLNQVGVILAEVFHVPEPPLLVKDIGESAVLGSYGDGYRYNPPNRAVEGADYGIHMNAEYERDGQLLFGSDPSQALETYAHEFRHCYQNEQVSCIRKPQFAHNADDFDRALRWLNNFESYIPAEVGFEAYWDQPVEVDARAFATQVVENLFG